jgi:uncharacterized membrane protein
VSEITVPEPWHCYGFSMQPRQPDKCAAWDAYAVWKILVHRHPVTVADVATSCGRIERELLDDFCEAILDYPDFLQDALLLLAHAKGVEGAAEALDEAVREHFAQSLAREAGQAKPAEHA